MTAFDLSNLRAYGDDVRIDLGAVIKRPNLMSVGSHIAIDHGVYVTTRLEMGDYIHIGPYTTVTGGAEGLLKMGNFSGLAAACRIVCGGETYGGDGMINPTIPARYRNCVYAPVIMEDFTTLATGVIVLPGITIREGSVVAAGSVVTKDTEPWTINVGTPARPVRRRPSATILRHAQSMGYNLDRKLAD